MKEKIPISHALPFPPHRSRPTRPSPGFTLIELLVVIVIIAILAGLLVPGLNSAKEKAQGIRCMSNMKQLQLGWNMYADDHQQILVYNALAPDEKGWITGILSYDGQNRYNTDTSYLVDPKHALLAPYTSYSAGIYKCPADRSTVRSGGTLVPRVRSLSMSQSMNSRNDWLNGFAAPKVGYPGGAVFHVFRKTADFAVMPASDAFVFIDEHPDAINYGDFAVPWVDPASPDKTKIVDTPASTHNGAGGLSYADGRAEIHKWVDPRTTPPFRNLQYWFRNEPTIYKFDSPGNPDMLWLSQRTTVRIDR